MLPMVEESNVEKLDLMRCDRRVRVHQKYDLALACRVKTEVLMRKSILFVLIIFALTAPAIGQTTDSNSEKQDNIRHLMTVMGVEKLTQTMLDQYLQAMKPILAKSSTNNEDVRKRLDRFSEIMSEEFKHVDLSTLHVELYDKYFTNDEIKGLIQFYESPVGKKYIEVLPAITQESMKRGMEVGSAVGQKALARLLEEFPELKNVLPGPRQK
jgi:uncharacterized protein